MVDEVAEKRAPSRPALSPSDLWCTPRWLLDAVLEVGEDPQFAIDPCPGPRGWTGARHEIRLDEGADGLEASWFRRWDAAGRHGLVFVNPPFGRGHLDLWAPKIVQEARQGATAGMEIVAVLPATPGPDWWQANVPAAFDSLCFLRGRPKFVDPATLLEAEGGGTKDSAIVYFGDRARAFERAFDSLGQIVRQHRAVVALGGAA